LEEQRLDVTEVGEGTAVTLLNPLTQHRDDAGLGVSTATAEALGLHTDAARLMSWDVFDAVLTPGNPILLQSWCGNQAASASTPPNATDTRCRTIRIVRDYGMFDRPENPQYYPNVARKYP
jgi:hypothetical protein